MVVSSSRLAFGDCYELMDRALEDARGIRIKFPNHGDAWHYRLRVHKARTIDRDDNVKIYDEDHIMFGRSVYDPIVVKINRDGDTFWLHLEKIDPSMFQIESLSQGDEDGLDKPLDGDRGEIEIEDEAAEASAEEVIQAATETEEPSLRRKL